MQVGLGRSMAMKAIVTLEVGRDQQVAKLEAKGGKMRRGTNNDKRARGLSRQCRVGSSQGKKIIDRKSRMTRMCY